MTEKIPAHEMECLLQQVMTNLLRGPPKNVAPAHEVHNVCEGTEEAKRGELDISI